MASAEKQLYLASQALDLEAVRHWVEKGVFTDYAFAGDGEGLLSPDSEETAGKLERLKQQGFKVSGEKEAIFELYMTLLNAGHPFPDGSSRRSFVRVIFGAGPAQAERAKPWAERFFQEGMLDWKTSAWAKETSKKDKKSGSPLIQLLPLNKPYELWVDALCCAAASGNLALLDHLSKPLMKDTELTKQVLRQDSGNPLFKALAHTQVECVEFLLNWRSEQEWIEDGMYSSKRRSAMMVAATNGQNAMVRWLLDNGYTKRLANEGQGDVIAAALQQRRRTIARTLIARGWNVNDVCQECSPLHMAVWMQYKDLYPLLIQAGQNVNLPDKHGQTPLMMAGMIGDKEAIEQLVAAGVDLEGKNHNGETALDYACIRNRQEAFHALLNAGANLESENNKGNTALMRVGQEGKLQAFSMLLEAGASLTHVNHQQQTALDLATGEVKAWLLEQRLERLQQFPCAPKRTPPRL